jgi:hypothetical protein
MQRADRATGDRAAWGIAFAIVAAVVAATLAFRGHLSDLVGPLPWFLRTYAAIIGPCEVAAAVLLSVRALRRRRRRAALLAAAYAISAPLVLENLFTLPGVFGSGALSHQTPPWCWTAWHLGWAACVLGFAWLPDRPLEAPLRFVGTAFALALAFGVVAAHADAWLPPVLAAGDTVSPLLFTLGWITIGLLLLSAFGLAAFRGAALDAWLLVAVFALALDEAFVLTTSVRFSVGTYLSRALGAVNAAAMLFPIGFERATERKEAAR